MDLEPGPVTRRRLMAGLACAGFWPAAVAAQSADAPTSVPLTANLFTRVAAAVTLNDQGPFHFVIDTGAVRTTVSDRVAAQLDLPPGPEVRLHGVTRSTLVPSARVRRLWLHGYAFHDLSCPVLSHDHLAADGLIGLDVLGRFRLRFDTAQHRVLMGHSQPRVLSGAHLDSASRLRPTTTGSIRGRFGQLIMTHLSVGGNRTAAFVDTGAQYSVGNLALRREIGASGSATLVRIQGVTGDSVTAEVGEVRDLRIDNHPLGRTPLLFADLHAFGVLGLSGRPALLVGADILGRFRTVVLDFAGNRVRFEGVRPPSTRPLEL